MIIWKTGKKDYNNAYDVIIISIRFFWENFRFSCNCKISYKELSFVLHLLSPSGGKVLYNYSSGWQPGNWRWYHPLILLGFHQFIMHSLESVCTCVCVCVCVCTCSWMCLVLCTVITCIDWCGHRQSQDTEQFHCQDHECYASIATATSTPSFWKPLICLFSSFQILQFQECHIIEWYSEQTPLSNILEITKIYGVMQ